jgi:hypothetical protein
MDFFAWLMQWGVQQHDGKYDVREQDTVGVGSLATLVRKTASCST